jgi:hypothetical protein
MGGFWRRRGFLWVPIYTLAQQADEHREFMLSRHRGFLIGITDSYHMVCITNQCRETPAHIGDPGIRIFYI